jgi:hypothetical protein
MVEKMKGQDATRQEKKRTARLIEQLTKKRGAKFSAHGKDFWEGTISFSATKK